jgi:hypothetical protein
MTPSNPTHSGSIEDPIQVVMHQVLVPAFKEWLASRGLHLAGPIPTDASEAGEDLPFYIIGINEKGLRCP